MCDDVEKLIKRRKMQDEQPIYYAIMEDSMTSSAEVTLLLTMEVVTEW